MTGDFTTADLAALVASEGITEKVLRGWIEAGFVVPVEGGGSQGKPRRFTKLQAVGVLVAAKVYESERGCQTTYVRLVVSAFQATDEGRLRRMLAKHGPYLLAVFQTGGAPIIALSDEEMDRVNVGEALEAVEALRAAAVR